MPEVTQLGGGGARIRTQAVWLLIGALRVGEAHSAHSRLSRKLINIEEEEREEGSDGEEGKVTVMRKVDGRGQEA